MNVTIINITLQFLNIYKISSANYKFSFPFVGVRNGRKVVQIRHNYEDGPFWLLRTRLYKLGIIRQILFYFFW